MKKHERYKIELANYRCDFETTGIDVVFGVGASPNEFIKLWTQFIDDSIVSLRDLSNEPITSINIKICRDYYNDPCMVLDGYREETDEEMTTRIEEYEAKPIKNRIINALLRMEDADEYIVELDKKIAHQEKEEKILYEKLKLKYEGKNI